MEMQSPLDGFEITLDLRISFSDPERSEEEARIIFNELLDVDEVKVERVKTAQLPDKTKAAGDFIWGLLKLKVSPKNASKLLRFLGDRLGNKPLKMKIKSPNGSEIELEANSREEFNFVLDKAKEFLKE